MMTGRKDWHVRVGLAGRISYLFLQQAGGDADAPLVAKAVLHLTRTIIKLVSGQSNKSVFF